MARDLLKDFRIGGDIIDQLAPRSYSVETTVSAELPPVGAGAEARELPVAAPSSAMDAPAETAPSEPDESNPALRLGKPTNDLQASTEPPATAGLQCKREGLFHHFTIGELSYRIGGVRPLFVTSLVVNIRASCGTTSFPDTVNLYAARARSSFALSLQRSFGAEPSRVEKDLVAILEYLEAERDAQLREGSSKPVIELNDADRELGLSLLRDPELFSRIVTDLTTLGYVGEDLNKQLLYLCASSRKLDDPISVLILSQSASGKSFLVDSVKKLMPSEEVVAVTSLSDQALNYIDDLSHKFLVLGEAVHGEVVEHQIREMLSGKELSRMVTIKDAETGKMQSKVIRTPVIVASVMSGTNHAINPENASRCFIINTDESKAQTQAIHTHQRQKYSLNRLRTGSAETERIIKTHQAAQRLLTKRHIVNDFAPLLDFPTSLMRLRRDHDRFLDLIACVCYLRQYQKEEVAEGSLSFIRCDLTDYQIAYTIMVEGVLSSTMRELPMAAQALYEEIRKLARSEAEANNLSPTEVSLTQRHIREASGFGQTWVKLTLRQLVDYEYLTIARGGNERSKGFYRLRHDSALTSVDLSMIPTPEAMKLKLVGKLVRNGSEVSHDA